VEEHHEIFDGRLHIYKRDDSRYWQCSTYLNDRNYRASTGHDSLKLAKEFAEDWYLTLRGKSAAGLLKHPEKTFNQAADKFVDEFEIITEGERNKNYVQMLKDNLRVYLRPFFGEKGLSEITAGLVQDYRIHRFKNPRKVKGKKGSVRTIAPSRTKLHSEIITIRHVLKTAQRHGWIAAVPNISPPYKQSGKVQHRAWFSAQEYRKLYLATRERAKAPRHNRNRWVWESEQMHDYVLFMANTGLRPDEADRLEFRDVKIVKDRDSGQTILEIEVRGKRGTGYCKSMPGAVVPFRRLKARDRKGVKTKPTDLLFPNKSKRHLFNTILDELKLKFDREGNRRTAYSLRHTYICLRLLEGADIYQVAKNCRTSVEMIEKHYAVHLKTSIDASAVNVRKPKLRKPKAGQEEIRPN
jgi:hypothetical protein